MRAVDLRDGGVRTLVDGMPQERFLSGVAVDGTAGLLFWGEGTALVSAPLDGGAPRTVVPGEQGTVFVTAVAVDPQARQLYWTDNATDSLSRASYDGTGVVQLFSSAPWSPAGPGNFTNPHGVALAE